MRVTKSLIRLADQQPESTRLVRYEDLVSDPILQTRKLYEFIGSCRQEGTKKYSAPQDYSWRWGSDDGSPNIRSLEVQPPREKKREEKRLLRLMKECEPIRELRTRLGYEEV